MNWLITGGAGFIGSHFIEYLLTRYPRDKVICLDKLTYAGSTENVIECWNNPRFIFVKGDICNASDVKQALQFCAVDCIVNFAAESHVDRSIDDANCFLQTNVLGTNVLLEAARKYSVPHFHQVSTDEVYGDLPLDIQAMPFTETDALRPSSAYAASKAAADLLVLSYKKTFGLSVTISRCSNNFGPKQHLEKFIPTVIDHAYHNQPIPIYGTGENVRDWVYVEDHCRAIDGIVRHGKAGEIYNVGGGCELSNNVLAKKILAILDKPDTLLSYVQDRPGHDLKYSLNCEKIHRELSWTASDDFDQRLAHTVDWYIKNICKHLEEE